MAKSPKIAHRKINKYDIKDINVEDVQVNDILVIRPGDLIPVDGIIFSDKAQIKRIEHLQVNLYLRPKIKEKKSIVALLILEISLKYLQKKLVKKVNIQK